MAELTSQTTGLIPRLARDVMTPDPACCSPDTTLDEVAKLMIHNDCGEIPVIDSADQIIGVVTDRDIVCMSEPVITVSADTGLSDVLSIMEKHQIRRIPVVDERGCCTGIISQADLAWAEPQLQVAELMRELSRDTNQASR